MISSNLNLVYKSTIKIIVFIILSIISTQISAQNPVPDSDGDGVVDTIDLDDDNDGITDCMEKGLSDTTSIEQIFKLNDNATKISANEVRLTEDNKDRWGQMWSNRKVDFNKSFTLTFQAYLGSKDGADGIATVFHNSPDTINAKGATVGLGLGAKGIANGIVLELDTYDNGTTIGDLAADHGQIWDSDNQSGAGLLTSAVALPDLENNAWHNVVISWNATTKNISYTVNGTLAGSFTGDLVRDYFDNVSKVYFGYTATTGGASNDQRIRFNNFCSDLPVELDSDNDSLPNHLDTDSDNDGCSDANEAYGNSTAQGTDGNMYYGNGNPPAVDANGMVTVASYSAYNSNVVNAGSASTITVQPTATSVTENLNTSISVSASGGSGTRIYRWQQSTNNGNSWTDINNGTVYSGATTATLTLTTTPFSYNGYEYRVAITQSDYPCAYVLSDEIKLTVYRDTDGDGIADRDDLDDDNDGISDCMEKGLSADSIQQIFKLNGHATTIKDSTKVVQLTPDITEKSGQMWSYGKVDFNNSFTLKFQAYLGTKDANGADGIATVFHNSPDSINAKGGSGGGLGARGIQNGIVLELDTWKNDDGDLPGDHGQIWDSDNQTSLSTAIATGNLEDGKWHNVVISWDATTKTISYTVNDTLLAGSFTGDLVKDYFDNASKVYFGYTASTGGSANEQKIRINNFCSDLPFELDSDNDGLPNHLDTDSDNDGCSDANENSTAQGTDRSGNPPGNPPAVDANGMVVGASYDAYSSNVVIAGSASTITVQPTATAVTENLNTSISVSASGGSGTTIYRWQESTDNGYSWTDINNGTVYSGATTATLTLTKTPLSYNGYKYRVAITQSDYSCAYVLSNEIKLTVYRDTDGDGIADRDDLDDDNDGISDCMEKGLSTVSSIEQIFELNGDATKKFANEVQLTPDSTYKSGQMWSYGKVDFSNSFTLNFQAYLGSKDGADGIATVFHNSPLGVNATGATGGGLGARGIANGIVLELDTRHNADKDGINFGDLDDDHGQIWDSDNQTSLTDAIPLPNLEDSAWHNVVISWNATTKTIWYTVNDTLLAGSFTGDLVTDYFGGDSIVYFGYTASTGGENNDQRIRINNFCSDLPFDLDSDNDGLPNHLDTDSDNDGCSDAIEAYGNMYYGNGNPPAGPDENMYYGDGNPPTVDANGMVVGANYDAYTDNVVIAGSASTINVQPTATSVTENLDTSISVSANGGSGTTIYRWQESTDNGDSWTDINNDTVYSGDTTATLTLTKTPLSYNGYKYRVAITQSDYPCAYVLSNEIKLTVYRDTDGDGIADRDDLDDDNDGISDCMEKGLSTASSIQQIFELNGNATRISDNEVQLTSNSTKQSGQMWSYGKVDFNKSFTLNFQAYLGDDEGVGGADGIATVFHNSPDTTNAKGGSGDGLGARGIKDGIVLELDTYNNGIYGDINADHGQIWDSDNQSSLTTAKALPNLEDSAWHDVVISWNATTKTISYTVDNTLAGSFTGDLVTNYFGGASKVYFGYTASTGTYTNDQRIRINNFCSDLPFDLYSDNDSLPNHLDTDSDNDGCYDAIEGGDNVLSEHLNSNGSINTATNGGVDINGVPNLVNSGRAADTDNKQGQSAGNAYNSTLNSCENYWIGTTGNSWEDAINWTAQEMPVPGEDLIFATIANNDTAALNDLKLPSGTEKTVGNLINHSEKALIIPAGSGLIVEGTVSGSETNAGKIVLEAKENTPNAALIVQNGCGTTVMATVQMYAKGNKGTTLNWTDNITGSPTEGQSFSSSYKWQYFGIPVSLIKADPAFYGSFLREYSEPKNADSSYYNKWNTLNNASILTAFKGYAITQDNPKVISLQGKLELCDREIKLTRTAAPVTGSLSNNIENSRYGLGQNIFGNSFTAAIPINQINFNNIKVDGSATTNDGTLVEKTVYLYNTGSFGEWTGVIGQVSADAVTAGTYRAIPNEVSSEVFNQIPSMQGFLLRHTGDIGAEITMTLPYTRLTKNTEPQTAPRAPLSHLEIELNSASTIDKLWLFSIPGTGNKFDNGWDGRKHFGTPTAFIYAPTADGNMQVNTTDNLIGTAIAFVPNEDKHYSLTLKKSNLDTQYDSLYLIDLMLNKAIALHGEVTTYEFSADQKGIASVRFFISNNPQTAAPEKSGLLWAYSAKKQLHAYNRTNEKCTIQIYDQIGRNMLVQNIAAQSSIQLNPNLHTGFYLVKMNAGNQSHATMIHFE